ADVRECDAMVTLVASWSRWLSFSNSQPTTTLTASPRLNTVRFLTVLSIDLNSLADQSWCNDKVTYLAASYNTRNPAKYQGAVSLRRWGGSGNVKRPARGVAPKTVSCKYAHLSSCLIGLIGLYYG